MKKINLGLLGLVFALLVMGVSAVCTPTEIGLVDTNGDCLISDTECLYSADLLAAGTITDACYQEVIDAWGSGTQLAGCTPSPPIPWMWLVVAIVALIAVVGIYLITHKK